MSRRGYWGCLVGIAAFAILTSIVVVVTVRSRRAGDEAALREQYRLARFEGIPTTWQEFGTAIKPSKPEENAARFYQSLARIHLDGTNIPELEGRLVLKRSKKDFSDAEAFLAKKKTELSLMDQASSMPHCWFDRNWSLGPSVLFREYSPMKYGAKLLAIRGSIEACQGRSANAVEDIQRILKVGRQVDEEGTQLSALVAIAMDRLALNSLALWSFAFPREPAYKIAFNNELLHWPKPNLQRMHREDFLLMMTLVEESLTPEGRRDLGLKPDDVPKVDGLMSFLLSQAKGRIKIAKAEREIWEAYGDTPARRTPKMEAAKAELVAGLFAFPVAYDIYDKLYQDDGKVDLTDVGIEARRITYVALQRALSKRLIPKSIKTSDLAGPFDGKPVDYKFDGQQIVITISSPDKDITLKMPSDSQLGKPAKT